MNHRKITGVLPKKISKAVNNKNFLKDLRAYLFFVLVVQLFVFLQIFVILNQQLEAKRTQNAKNLQNYTYWRSISVDYPKRPDILFNLGKSAYDVGRVDEAYSDLNKALSIDPLFAKAIEFKKEIE